MSSGDDLMDAKPSLLALTPVVRSMPVPMQPITWYIYSHSCTNGPHVQPVVSHCLLTSLQLALRTGKVNSFGWLRYSGFVRHKEPHLDAAGALADLLVFTLNLTGLDILHKIQSQDTTW